MEAFGSDPSSAPSWVARIVEIIQPLTLRADQLGSMALFEGFGWTELEAAARLFDEVEVARGTRLTVQGRPDSRLWLILEGEALVSADARPLRVAQFGDAAGIAGMLYQIKSPETAIALSSIRALAAGPRQFSELVKLGALRPRLTALAGERLRARRLSKLR